MKQKVMFFFFLWTLVISTESKVTFANDIHFNHVNEENGLIEGSVSSITQDKQGFIWIGTGYGLYRYDGYQMKAYSAGMPGSISDNSTRVYTDRDGNLWVGTNFGLNRYEAETDTFIHYFHDPNNYQSISDNLVRFVSSDESGGLWVATQGGGLNYFDLESQKFIRYSSNGHVIDDIDSYDVLSLLVDNKSQLWFSVSGKGLFLLNPKEGFEKIELPIKPSPSIWAIEEDANGKIWIGSYNDGVYVYDPMQGSAQSLTELNDKFYAKEIWEIKADSNRNIWIGTQHNGLYSFDLRNNSFFNYRHNIRSYSLSDDSIRSLFYDKEGNLWLGTRGKGVMYFNPTLQVFQSIDKYNSNNGQLDSPWVNSVIEDLQGNLLIGTGQGIRFKEKGDNFFQQLQYDSDINKYPLRKKVSSLLEDKHEKLWIGTQGGLYKEQSDGIFKYYSHQLNNNNSLSFNYITGLFEDVRQQIWVFTYKGLNLYLENDRFHQVLEDSFIISLEDEGARHLWVGTYKKGLILFNKEDKIKVKQLGPKQGLPEIILSLYKDSEEKLWVGTDKGLFLYRNEQIKSSIDNFDLNQLPIYRIIPDHLGHIWVSTKRGLFRINKKTNKVVNFNKSDGLANAIFISFAGYASSSGMLYFGKEDGLTFLILLILKQI